MTITFDPIQLAAIEAASTGTDRIITGGAGTGKTTIIQAIAQRATERSQAIIMAPTGKAAARLKEATGFYAETVHRALRWDGDRFHRDEPLNGVCIIDEASMLDSWLLAKIIEHQPRQLVLVGDVAQLPPVGKGQPFHDLVALRPDLVSRLTTCYRAQGAVHIAAQAIRAGRAPLFSSKSGGESFKVLDTGGPVRTINKLVEWVKQGYYDPEQDIIVAARYGDKDSAEDADGGIHSINRAIRAVVNPSPEPWAVGDRVLNTKNCGELDFWNGDLGTITAIDSEKAIWITVDRKPEEPILVGKKELQDISHAYCISVHKSQGSQFRRVFFVCFQAHARMLDRSLIYTAITRAKEGVCVVGERRVFLAGIRRQLTKTTIIQQLAKEPVHGNDV